MAVVVTFDIPGGTEQQYEQVIATVFPEGKLPDGWLVHLVDPTENGWRVLNVVPSQEQFEAFAREPFLRATQQVGVAIPQLTFFPVHRLIRVGRYLSARQQSPKAKKRCWPSPMRQGACQPARVVRECYAAVDGFGEIGVKRMGIICSHLDQIHDVEPQTMGCEECLQLGAQWALLRMCRTCGHVGCCDTSRYKHATAHFHATGHAIVTLLERVEETDWCYIDELYVGGQS